MAWSQSAELLALYALIGGFATPLLVSTGGNHQTFLFSYLASLAAATVLLLRARPWPRLLIPAFLATAAYFIAWYATWFHRSVTHLWDSQSTQTALFAFLFFALFTLPSLRGWVKPATGHVPASRNATLLAVLLPFANAAFLTLALYSVFQDSGLHTSLAWLMVALAALALALTRIQATTLGTAMQLAVAVILLTVAVPLKASGHTLTTAWLVEGLVLYWASTRIPRQPPSPTLNPVSVLRLLSFGGFLLGLGALAFFRFNAPSADLTHFFNATLGTAAVAASTLAGTAWLASGPATEENDSHHPVHDHTTLILTLTAIALVAFLLIVPEFNPNSTGHPAFTSAPFLTALVGLAILAASALAAARLSPRLPLRELTILASADVLSFNLFAVLIGVREINALWQNTPNALCAENSVQRALATSAFLMLYGAVLLAAGFWRRNAFIRWQALALLVFTILKVFLYDVSGLSQGARVISFLLLGALLMAVSYAYQKDWLGLKASTAKPQDPTP